MLNSIDSSFTCCLQILFYYITYGILVGKCVVCNHKWRTYSGNHQKMKLEVNWTYPEKTNITKQAFDYGITGEKVVGKPTNIWKKTKYVKEIAWIWRMMRGNKEDDEIKKGVFISFLRIGQDSTGFTQKWSF